MHGTVTIAKWTERDEAQLRRALESAAFWRNLLDGDEIETWTAEGRFLNRNMPSGLDLITAEALQ
jgi:hypothetical protein